MTIVLRHNYHFTILVTAMPFTRCNETRHVDFHSNSCSFWKRVRLACLFFVRWKKDFLLYLVKDSQARYFKGKWSVCGVKWGINTLQIRNIFVIVLLYWFSLLVFRPPRLVIHTIASFSPRTVVFGRNACMPRQISHVECSWVRKLHTRNATLIDLLSNASGWCWPLTLRSALCYPCKSWISCGSSVFPSGMIDAWLCASDTRQLHSPHPSDTRIRASIRLLIAILPYLCIERGLSFQLCQTLVSTFVFHLFDRGSIPLICNCPIIILLL